MKSWWLVIALLLSIGLNVGILAAISARRNPPAGPPERDQEVEAGPRPEDGDLARPEPGNPVNDPVNNPINNPVPALPRLADRLRLEGEERRKFIDIQWNLFQETTRLRLQRGEIQRELKRELTREETDRKRVDALLAESARNHDAMERALVNSILSSRALLGPEQEREYLRFVGRLRVPNPGLGFQGQGPGDGQGPPNRNRPFQDRLDRLDRMRQRRMMRQEGFPEGPPP